MSTLLETQSLYLPHNRKRQRLQDFFQTGRGNRNGPVPIAIWAVDYSHRYASVDQRIQMTD